MFQWLKRLFCRRVHVVYFPEVEHIKAVRPGEEEGLLLQMVDGYEKHEPFFRLVMLYLRRKEGEMSEVPLFKNPDELFAWQEATKRSAIEANVLRMLARLPIKAKRLKEKTESGDKNTQEYTGLYVDD